jgi:hypothetical protein
MAKTPNEPYSDDEASRRMNEALRRALTTPPKPQADMKLGKGKASKGLARKLKMRPASKGRVHKGKTRA